MTRATLIALFLATQAQASTLDYLHTGDPEPLRISYVDGRISFAKDGPYVGGGKGCKRVWAGKDMRFDRVDYVDDCKPRRFGGVPLIGEVKAAAPTSDALLLATKVQGRLLSAASGQSAGRLYRQRSKTIGQVERRNATAMAALNYWMGSSTVERGAHNASDAGSNPAPSATSPVPLPAAGLMLIAALGGLAALRRKRT